MPCRPSGGVSPERGPMTFPASFSLVPLALAGTLAALVGACTPDRAAVPPYYADLARVDAQVDAATAAQMISSYRQSNGKPPLTVDPALMQAARKQAAAMAEAGDVRASLQPGNTLKARLAAVGEPNTHAVENVSAGYRTLAEAFSGWRESPSHNAVLLDDKATRMGIATAHSSGSKYRVFWSLVLAAPPTAR